MTTYFGDRTIDGPVVLRDGVALDPRYTLKAYSPHPMDWGCDAPEARQLAFALLFDHFRDADVAARLAPAFSRGVVAELDNEWELDSAYLSNAAELLLRG